MSELAKTKVHTLPKGKHIAPMPALRTGHIDRKLQGGLAPVAYRSANARWCEAMNPSTKARNGRPKNQKPGSCTTVFHIN